MKEVLVLGAGKFGKRSVETLIDAGYAVTVIDRDAAIISVLSAANLTAICSGAKEYLAEVDVMDFGWIIPALPLHAVLEWVIACLDKMGIQHRQIPVPDITVPNPYRGPNGSLCASFAAHICPNACPEPDGACFLTGEERTVPLYKMLSKLKAPGFDIAVIQSHQLFTGLGGLKPAEMKQLLQRIVSRRRPVIIATSCACHAVLDALTF